MELTDWLKLMLGEIARKRADAERAQDEEAARRQEAGHDEAQAHTTKRGSAAREKSGRA